MSWVAISKELTLLVAKRQLGAGEWNYVSLQSGKEVRGKGELLELLQKEKKGWQKLIKLKSSKESDLQFQKTVKKRLDYVPVVTEPVKPTEEEEEDEEEPELVELADSDDESTIPEDVVVPDMEKMTSSTPIVEDVEEADVTIPFEDEDSTEVNGAVKPNTSNNSSVKEVSENGTKNKLLTTESTSVANEVDITNEKAEKRKKKPKAGPRSKVKRARSTSPEDNADSDGKEKKIAREKVSFDNMVGCKGFGLTKIEDLLQYFKHNHENVEKVVSFKQVFVKFKDAESVKRFSTLNYIRHLGNTIEVFNVDQFFKDLDETDQQNMLDMVGLSSE